MVTRSEISKRTWRARKRGPGKGTCYFCKKKIFAGGVIMRGRKLHKGCAEAKGAGLVPAQIGKNPRIDAFTKQYLEKDYPFIIEDWLKIKKAVESGTSPLDVANEMNEVAASLKWKEYPIGKRVLKSLENGLFDTAYEELTRWFKKIGYNPRRITRRRAPRDAFRYFGAEELNPKRQGPKYVFGPTGYRPPAKWFSRIAQGASASYFGKKLKDLTRTEAAKVGQIVGGIWAKFSDVTRLEILKKYEPSAVRTNPTQMLSCPVCGINNPVNRAGVYLKCRNCRNPLRVVKVRR